MLSIYYGDDKTESLVRSKMVCHLSDLVSAELLPTTHGNHDPPHRIKGALGR